MSKIVKNFFDLNALRYNLSTIIRHNIDYETMDLISDEICLLEAETDLLELPEYSILWKLLW
jgi:hypothetical protein